MNDVTHSEAGLSEQTVSAPSAQLHQVHHILKNMSLYHVAIHCNYISHIYHAASVCSDRSVAVTA